MWSKGQWAYDLLKERYGEEIGVWLGNKLRNVMRKQIYRECTDNFRVADLDRPKEVKEYQQAARSGCCGYFDEIFVHPSGRKFKIGFNFGH